MQTQWALIRSALGEKFTTKARFLVAFLALFFVLQGWAIATGSATATPGIFIPMGLLVFLAGVWLLIRWQVLRAFRTSPHAGKVVRWKISRTGLRTEWDGSSASLAWEAVIQVSERRRGYLLKTGSHTGHWLPVAAFRDPADRELLHSWIRESKIPFGSWRRK